VAPIAARATFAGRSVLGVVEIQFPESTRSGDKRKHTTWFGMPSIGGQRGNPKVFPGAVPTATTVFGIHEVGKKLAAWPGCWDQAIRRDCLSPRGELSVGGGRATIEGQHPPAKAFAKQADHGLSQRVELRPSGSNASP